MRRRWVERCGELEGENFTKFERLAWMIYLNFKKEELETV